MPNQNVLLAWMGCGSAKGHVADLAGLRATPIQQRGTVEHIHEQDPAPCHITEMQLCIRSTFF